MLRRYLKQPGQRVLDHLQPFVEGLSLGDTPGHFGDRNDVTALFRLLKPDIELPFLPPLFRHLAVSIAAPLKAPQCAARPSSASSRARI